MKTIWSVALMGFALALVLAAVLSPLASPRPDGLERVAEDKGFAQKARDVPPQGRPPLPDYSVPGVRNERASTALAGAIGTVAAFAIGLGVALGIRSVGRRCGQDPP